MCCSIKADPKLAGTSYRNTMRFNVKGKLSRKLPMPYMAVFLIMVRMFRQRPPTVTRHTIDLKVDLITFGF